MAKRKKYATTELIIKRELIKKLLENYPDVLTPEQVQEVLQTGRNTLYSMLKNGKIRSLKIGGKYRIPKLFVVQYLLDDENNNEVCSENNNDFVCEREK